MAFILAAATGFSAYNISAEADTRPCHSIEYERKTYGASATAKTRRSKLR